MKDVSVIIVPRERFSAACDSLRSILTHTPEGCEIICVDGKSPPPVANELLAIGEPRAVKFVRYDSYLSPNRARNIGFSVATGQHVIFIDNDVFVSPRWLEAMVGCATETGAAIVGPLTCIGMPLHDRIHSAGLFFHVRSEGENGQQIIQENPFADRKVSEARQKLCRQACDYVEFHCTLVNREALAAVGPLDEKLLSTREHIDFCMTVKQRGGKVYFEPESVVTYLAAPPIAMSDLPYFMLRWSDEWERKSLQHFQEKWSFQDQVYFERRMRNLGSMRRILVEKRMAEFLQPLLGRKRAGVTGRAVVQWTRPAERLLSRLLVSVATSSSDRCQVAKSGCRP